MLTQLAAWFFPYYFVGLLCGYLLRCCESYTWEKSFLNENSKTTPARKPALFFWILVQSIAVGLPLAFVLIQLALHYDTNKHTGITSFLITTFSTFIAVDLRNLLNRGSLRDLLFSGKK